MIESLLASLNQIKASFLNSISREGWMEFYFPIVFYTKKVVRNGISHRKEIGNKQRKHQSKETQKSLEKQYF
jgi:hypothetical protein